MKAELQPALHELRLSVSDVGANEAFNLVDGRCLHNLLELQAALDSMNDDIFRFHVNDYKNDFASWVKYAMHEETLSGQLDSTKDRMQHQLLVLKHLFSAMR